MYRIREFNEKDAPAVAEIFADAFNGEMALGMPPLEARQVIEFSKRPGVRILVCEKEGTAIIGFLTMAEGSLEYPAQINLIGVKSLFRRRGLGKELVKEAAKRAEAIGGKKVKLFTRPWNSGMREICIQLGFVQEAYLRKDYLNEDLLLFSLFLPREPSVAT